MGGRLLISALVLISAVIVAWFFATRLTGHHDPPQLPDDGWFGSGKKRSDDTKIEQFKINVADEVLQDLRSRLEKTRFFEPLEDSLNFYYGFNNAYLKQVKTYWLEKFDWRKQEALLNQFHHYKTEIEGLRIHFIHEKPPEGKYKRVIPLIIVHGWPGSVWEFHKILPMLTDPQRHMKSATNDFAFEVIAPSIPGYGFSSEPRKTGFGPPEAGRVFNKLMTRLKFKQYVAQGGDWGSLITKCMATFYPERVLGLHLNMFFVQPQDHPLGLFKFIVGAFAPSLVFSGRSAKLNPLADFITLIKESGYMHLQATKPDTVGMGLNDSPLGLAAYILEKFSGWTDPTQMIEQDGGLTRKFTLDELLTNVMIYWTNANIASSQRFYREAFSTPLFQAISKAYVRVPTGIASFPNDLVPPAPREMAEVAMNVTRFTEMPTGGHFAALEEPRLLASDLFAFVDHLQIT